MYNEETRRQRKDVCAFLEKVVRNDERVEKQALERKNTMIIVIPEHTPSFQLGLFLFLPFEEDVFLAL